MTQPRCFVVVLPRDAVDRNVAAGLLEAAGGRRDPLTRLDAGDWVAFYSPRAAAAPGAPLQAFTAICEVAAGAIAEGPPRHADADASFHRPARYVDAQMAPIRPLIDTLDFIRDKHHWGVALRYGFVRVSVADFERIATAMRAAVPWQPVAA
ncbi:MAG: EVE domain-containing protein [Proteobacteria bacterium]|nr:EVE domain-containing protein [Pseudomonadota bacterium]